jgi:glucose/arabinose dehydrogenase
MRHSIFLLSLAIVALFLAACNGDDSSSQARATAAAMVGPEATAGPSDTATAVTAGPSPSPIVPPTETARPATATRTSPTLSPSPAATSSPEATATPSAAPTSTATPRATPAVTSTAALARDPATVVLQLEAVVGGLTSPSGIVTAGDGSGRLFILEQPGRIRIVDDGRLLDAPFLDMVERVTSRGNEQGLLGLAFHPRFPENGRFFVNYTGANGNTVISSWSVSQDPNRAETGSESLILGVEQPAANHNGGHLVFGPEGYLYIGLGDGGGGGDTYGNGQNGGTLLGAMLRLDVDGANPYTVPGDNPFLDDAGVRDEIWAIGLRNPWRYSFDRVTGDLYIADVGQNAYEEVNFQPAGSGGGENYGWPILEGNHCFSRSGCDSEGLTMPIWEYDHSAGCSVTGGFVYRGSRYPVLQGIYVVGDYCSGNIWGLAQGADGEWRSAVLAQTDARLTSFGEDDEGELFLVDRGSGTLYHLAAQPRP